MSTRPYIDNERRTARDYALLINAGIPEKEAARIALRHEGDWKLLSENTVWVDGRDVVLFAYDMEVQARFCPGQWSDDTPISPAEYDGAVWSCFDDQFHIEIEEIGHDPAGWDHGRATHWREPSPPLTLEGISDRRAGR